MYDAYEDWRNKLFDVASSIRGEKNKNKIGLQNLVGEQQAGLQEARNVGASQVARIQYPEFLQAAQARAWDAEAEFKDTQGRVLLPAQADYYHAGAGLQRENTAGQGIANRVAQINEDYLRDSIPGLEKRRDLNLEGTEDTNRINLVNLYTAMNKAGLDTTGLKERIAGLNPVGNSGVAVPSEDAMSYAPGDNNTPSEPTWRQHPLITGTAAVLPYAMGAGGAVLGSSFGPAGTVLGGAGAGMAGQHISNWLTGEEQSVGSTIMGGIKGATASPTAGAVGKALPYASKVAQPIKKAFIPKPPTFKYGTPSRTSEIMARRAARYGRSSR